MMDSLSASDAKREFGEVLLKAQQGPVGINKNGKPVAVIVSATEYALLESMKEERLRTLIQEGLQDLDAGRLSDGAAVIEGLRKRLP